MKLDRFTQFISMAILIFSLTFSGCKLWDCDCDRDLAEEAESLTWLTENFPPYNYGETGSLNGVSIEILDLIFEKNGLDLSSQDVQLTSWTDGYEQVLSTEGTVLFSMVKNEERTDLFKWVGPIAPHKEVIIAQAGEGVKIQSEADLNNYTFGVVDGYPSFSLLRDKGVDQGNIRKYDNPEMLYTALFDREVRCISYSEQANQLILSSMGEDPANFTVAFTLQVDQLFYAFNPSVSGNLINWFQEALDDLNNDKDVDGSSTVEKILQKYTVILQAEDPIPDDRVIGLVNTTASDLEQDTPGTIAKMNKQDSPYRDADIPALYSFAYDTDLTIVAHAANENIVGKNFKGKPDAAGKLFRDEILAGALDQGTGWVDYIYTKPDKSGLYKKTTYYKLTTGSDGEQYVVCAGKYK